MKICDNCGARFDDFEDFCPECGAPFNEEFIDEPDDFEEHLKTCPQCGEYIPLDSMVCPSCNYVFRKKSNKKLYMLIGGGVLLVAVIVVAIVLLTGGKKPPISVVEATTAPVIAEVVETAEPAPVVTAEPVQNEPVPEEPAVPDMPEDNSMLIADHEQAITIFNLLDEPAAGEETVVVYNLDGAAKAVSVTSAEMYVTKLLSLAFGNKAGFEYNFYRADDNTWRLVMSGTLKDAQMAKMLETEDNLIYSTFSNMYLNMARQIVNAVLKKDPSITLSVYSPGKSGDDYSLRISETAAGNGSVTRAATA